MIIIAFGANLPATGYDGPAATIRAALDHLAGKGILIISVSPFYETAPIPASDQPWFVNGVAEMSTELSPADLLRALHDTEDHFGRVRSVPNAARVLDIDLIDYNGQTVEPDGGGEGSLILPHPRMHQRAFVLYPLCDIAPDWRHPTLDRSVTELIDVMPPDQGIRRLGE